MSHFVSAASRHRRRPCRRAAGCGRRAASPATGSAVLELVADVAEQLRQHVFEREEAGGAAELVDDQRLMRAALAQLAGARGRRSRSRARSRSGESALASVARWHRSAAHEPADEVLRVQHADDVVDRVAVDGQPRDTGSARRWRSPRAAACRCRCAEILRRGTISCLACRRLSRSARCRRRCSSGSSRPPSRLSAMSSSISSGEWMWRWPAAARRAGAAEQPGAVQPLDERPVDPQRRQPSARACRARTASGYCSASDFGTSSRR